MYEQFQQENHLFHAAILTGLFIWKNKDLFRHSIATL